MNPAIDENRADGTMVVDRAEAPPEAPVVRRAVEPEAPRKSLLGRVVNLLMIGVVVVGGVLFGLYKMRPNIPALHTSELYTHLDAAAVHVEEIKGKVVGKYESYFHKEEAEAHHEPHKMVVTTPLAMPVTIVQPYVCQIHSQRHIEIRAMDDGYLEALSIKEGQPVKKSDPMFSVIPVLYKAELAAEVAERDLAKLDLDYTKTLADQNGVSQKEVALFRAKLARAQAKVDLAQARLNFATVKAPFDGIIDKLEKQEGSLVKEGEVLTTLSDNHVMWVYFYVTEKRYLEYMADLKTKRAIGKIELVLANGHKFDQLGMFDPQNNVGAIEANFNNETGNIPFRADFPNPERLLRHKQTGTVLISKVIDDAIVIPQRATFENLAKRYVYIVGEDHVVHQREITIEHEQDDIFVISKGVTVKDRIILEGIRQAKEGEKVEFDFIKPEEALKDQKNHAE